MIEIPDPVSLDPPPGDAGALEDVVEDVAGAAYWLTVLSSDLSGPAASAPGWLGADAAAAAAQVGAVAGIATDCSAAVAAAAHRLRRHHDLLVQVRRQIAALQEGQDADFAAAWQRLGAMGDLPLAVMNDVPELLAVVEPLRASEAARRAQHAALLEELAEDAAVTAAVLAGSSAVVGGQGSRGDGDRVLLYLAAELPGWGEGELAARGEALAQGWIEVLDPLKHNELARRALVLASSPAFAEALLVGLGRDKVSVALTHIGDGVVGSESALARLLATVFGSAPAGGPPGGPLDRVLSAQYVQDAQPDGAPDHVMYGLAAVLRASTALPSGGLRQQTVVGWSRQILARERALLDITGGPQYASTGDVVDSLPEVLGALNHLGSPSAAAAVLSERIAWPLLLGRPWMDGGAALAEVAALAGADAGPEGERATRLGLEALGSGLADGDPDGWTVDRGTAAAVSPALASAVARHVTVATGVLSLGVDGELGGRAGDVLRGLGYLTLDERAEQAVEAALAEWVRAQPVPVELLCGPLPLPVVAVPSAFLAVREYGQRLAHALEGFELQAQAERDERMWQWTVGLLVELPKHAGWGAALGIVEGYAAMALDRDGRWETRPDSGRRFDEADAAGAVLAATPTVGPGVRAVLAGHAQVVFDRTSEALGEPRAPVPEERNLVAPLVEAAAGAAVDGAWKKAEFPPTRLAGVVLGAAWNAID
jgi:hypothetical protein